MTIISVTYYSLSHQCLFTWHDMDLRPFESWDGNKGALTISPVW